MGSEIQTEGPFARLAAQRQPAQPSTTASTSSAVTSAPSNAKSSARDSGLGQKCHADGRNTVETRCLDFTYPGIDGRPLPGIPPVVRNMSVEIPAGSRCLLVGANGAGKTTLLKVLGGKHMVPQERVRVLGEPPFHNVELTACGDLSYLGGTWSRDIAFAGYSIPLQGDFAVSKMVDGLPDVDPSRKQRLLEVLDVDLEWRMHTVSDGQRRRVQLLMGLLKPFQVLLLDEITVDLDVLGRANLLRYLREETEQRKATIVYATHIFDGLESWPTHLMYLAGGSLKIFEPASSFPQLEEGRLLELVEGWLREEAATRTARPRKEKQEYVEDSGELTGQAEWSNGWAAGRMTSTIRDSTNAVMRM